MKLAYLMLVVDDSEPMQPQLSFENCDIGHFVNAAAMFDEYAHTPNLWKAISGAGEFRGKPYGETQQVATLEFRDDEGTLEFHARKLKVFHARGAAHFLRMKAWEGQLTAMATQGFLQGNNVLMQAQQSQKLLDTIQLPAGVRRNGS